MEPEVDNCSFSSNEIEAEKYQEEEMSEENQENNENLNVSIESSEWTELDPTEVDL